MIPQELIRYIETAIRLKELQGIIADETRLKSIFHRMFEEEKR